MPHSGILGWDRGIFMAHWMVEKMDIQTGSQSMVAYVWPVRSVYLPLLSTYSNYSFFLWRTRRGIDFSPPVSVFTYIIYNILYFQPPSYIYIYILYFWLAAQVCGQPAAWWSMQKRFVTKAVTDSDRWPEIWSWAIQIEAYLALPSQKKTRAWCSSGEYTLHWRWKVTGY